MILPQTIKYKITFISIQVTLKALLGHTVEQLFITQKPVIDSYQIKKTKQNINILVQLTVLVVALARAV